MWLRYACGLCYNALCETAYCSLPQDCGPLASTGKGSWEPGQSLRQPGSLGRFSVILSLILVCVFACKVMAAG